MDPANRRRTSEAVSAPLPAISSFTSEKQSVDTRQIMPSEGGLTNAAVLVGPVAPIYSNRSMKPTAIFSSLMVRGFSFETTKRRMSSDMSDLMSDKLDSTTLHDQFASTCVRAGESKRKD